MRWIIVLIVELFCDWLKNVFWKLLNTPLAFPNIILKDSFASWFLRYSSITCNNAVKELVIVEDTIAIMNGTYKPDHLEMNYSFVK